MFRATHAINIFQKYILEKAAAELNHARVATISKHYIKVEDRRLLKNEEEELFDDNLDKIIFGDTRPGIKTVFSQKKIK